MYNQQTVLVISESFFPNNYHFQYDIVNGKTKFQRSWKSRNQKFNKLINLLGD